MKNTHTEDTMAIDLLIVFDTTQIIKSCPKPSLDKTLPLPIKINSQYVFCTGARNLISGQGKAKLSILAYPNDAIKFRGVSVYQNSTDAMIIYQVKNMIDDDLSNQSVPYAVAMDNAVQPDPDSTSFDGLPALHVKENFMSLDSKIQSSGQKNYRICFALYRLTENGETQNLYGFFYWDFKLKIYLKVNDTII